MSKVDFLLIGGGIIGISIARELKSRYPSSSVCILEKNLGIKAKFNMMPMQDGDVRKSHADVDDLVRDFEYAPKWNIKDGIKHFIHWYIDYYKINLPIN